jgi:Skp family chaperone for outer membrane proteins
MKRHHTLGVSLLAGLMLLAQPLSALAETIGYVDMGRVYNGYKKAQQVMADIKVKEADLRKMQADYVKQLEESRAQNTSNPVAASQLEKDLNTKLEAKLNEYRDWAAARQKELDDSLDLAIQNTAKAKGISVVLNKQAVYVGGVDMTNDVLAKLNPAGGAAAAGAK